MKWEIENNPTSEKYERISYLREGMVLYGIVREFKWWWVGRCDLGPTFEAQLIVKDNNKVITLGLFYDVKEAKTAITELVERLYK